MSCSSPLLIAIGRAESIFKHAIKERKGYKGSLTEATTVPVTRENGLSQQGLQGKMALVNSVPITFEHAIKLL
eukprot:1156135-Pelagomonas_calceolata.AAC.4